MTTGIGKSVGKGAVNLPADVATVRQLLAGFVERSGKPPLGAGPMDQPTIDAITRFQAEVVKMAKPDGCVDPNGKTIAALLEQAPQPAAPAPTPSVTYSSGVAAELRLVSPYAFEVVRRGVAAAGMKAAVITSTLRLPARQAAIMYDNAVQNLQAQFNLYGAAGDEVLKVFQANRTLPRATVVALMTKKIEQLLDGGRQVSNHVTTPAGYAGRNVIDIGVNSTKVAAGATFDLKALTRAFTRLQSDGFIAKFIDETARSNTCWHLEIVPGARPL